MIIQAVSRQCFQMYAVKNPISSNYGNWNFVSLKIGLEEFLNFFHVYR